MHKDIGLFVCIYLQNKVHHSFTGLEKQLLKPNTQHFPFQSVSHGVTDAQLVANLIQTRLAGSGKMEERQREILHYDACSNGKWSAQISRSPALFSSLKELYQGLTFTHTVLHQ